jgi:hypothetical protein
LKEEYLTERCKKKQGFSTFLRGCNPVPRSFDIDPEQSNQSTFGGKNKTIFHKAENTVTFDGEIIIT